MLLLTFQVGTHHLALEVGRIHEIVPYVRLQPVACSPAWLAGVFIYRGKVVPVLDLHRLLGMGECPVHLSTRIILVSHGFDQPLTLPSSPAEGAKGRGQERFVGLLAANVAAVREFPQSPPTPNRFAAAGRPDLGPVLVDGQEIIHLVELDRLLPELSDEKLTLLTKEPSA
ncbi:MAG TPA: chemotaxis protein CheW [Gemmataceae bacterium]|nr:chemotaxis protein CheW [Gemmataceae bacterium]